MQVPSILQGESRTRLLQGIAIGAVASISALYRSFTRVGALPVPTLSLVTGGAVGAGRCCAGRRQARVACPRGAHSRFLHVAQVRPVGKPRQTLGSND